MAHSIICAGQYDEAQSCFKKIIAAVSNSEADEPTRLYAQTMQAMTEWQLGQHDEARQLLADASKLIDEELKSDSKDWNHRATLLVLRRQATDLFRDSGTPKEMTVDDKQ